MTSFQSSFSLDLTGQVAFVTGASSGLGERFAQVLAHQGANVALVGRRLHRLQALADSINERDQGHAYPVQMDMRDSASFAPALDDVAQKLGEVSILINNAGVPDGNFAMRLSHQAIDEVIETNLRGPYTLACEVARRLKAADQGGRIVNVASMLAFDYSAASAASLYATTKSGIIRMTEALALEWARFHINLNAIAPGLFESEMTDGMSERMDVAGAVERFPRKRMGQAADLDSTLLFLVSPSSRMVTGTVVKVDDGQGHR